MSDRQSSRHGQIRLYFAQKNRLKKIIFDFKEIFFLLISLLNFISMALLNNGEIHHDNKNEILCDIDIKKLLA